MNKKILIAACAALVLPIAACGDDDTDDVDTSVDLTVPEATGDAPATTMPMSTTMPGTMVPTTPAP